MCVVFNLTRMNNVNPESKSAAIKTLAIIGFIAAIVLALWIAVSLVRYIPTAFSSLASITDSIYGQSGLTIKAEKDIVNSGEPLRISWMPLRTEGSYVVTYHCVDGISAETRSSVGDIVRFGCEEQIKVASGQLVRSEQTTDLVFTSERQRFTDVPYTFTFYPKGKSEALYERSGVVTIVNATIPQSGIVAGESTGIARAPVTTPSKSVTPTPTTPSTPSTPAPIYYKTVPVTTTTYPVSDPNGYTDLEVTFLGVGTLHNGVLVPESSLESGDDMVLQFAVKNTGTKTSSSWTFAANYPGEEDDHFVSRNLVGLLPGERAVQTLYFTVQDSRGTETIRVSASTHGDVKTGNNTATKTVKVTN